MLYTVEPWLELRIPAPSTRAHIQFSVIFCKAHDLCDRYMRKTKLNEKK